MKEAIPLSLTLLYPFVPRDSLTDGHFTALQDLFAARSPFAFELTHVAEFPGIVMYAVPEPDDDLRATMRALWALFPDYPPYGRAGSDPPPHATLAQLDHDPDTVRNAVPKRVEGLLPARFDVREATLMEEHRPDRWRVRASFPFAGQTTPAYCRIPRLLLRSGLSTEPREPREPASNPARTNDLLERPSFSRDGRWVVASGKRYSGGIRDTLRLLAVRPDGRGYRFVPQRPR